MLMESDGICGHNIIAFDIPVLIKIFPWFRPPECVHDTLIMARLIYPHIGDMDRRAISKGKRPKEFTSKLIGSHKLEAYGYRLGILKGEYDGGWEDFTPAMEEYAEQDPVVTLALYNKLLSTDYSMEAIELECLTAMIIFWQERFGFQFNIEAANDLERILRGRHAELGDELREVFGTWEEPERKGGKPVQFVPKRDNKKLGYTAGVPIQRYKTISFNPGSRAHIANRMTELFGWRPVEFTPSGQPKVDETTLNGLDYPEAKLLVEYLTVDKRLGQLAEGKQAWLKQVQEDGRIHGRVNTLGAITRRMTHSNPNVAQVPSIVNASGVVPYGKECRTLFCVAQGNKIMGCDAEGLELRMLAHYMARYDKGAYGDTVVNGKKEDGTDVHTMNQKFIGLNGRNSAKTWIYAYLYGAGNLKLGTVIYEDMTPEKRAKFNAKYPAGDKRDKALARLGTIAKRRVEEGLPALGKLQERVKQVARRGYIKTVDGGRIRVRSQHAALNTLLQGGGAVVMKKALVILYQDLINMGFEVEYLTGRFVRGGDVLGFVANVHDEIQMEVPEHLAEEIGIIAADAIRRAGEELNLKCPLAGSYDIGDSWADSH